MSEGSDSSPGIIKLAEKHPITAIVLAVIFAGGSLAGIYFTKKPNVNTTRGPNSPNVTGNGNAVGTGNTSIATNVNSGNQQIAPRASNVQQNNAPIGVQNNAPVGTQYNAPSFQTTINVVVIGGPLTESHLSPAKGSDIDGTPYTLARLKEVFPLGFVIFRKMGEKEWEYTPDLKELWDWKVPPTVHIRPDFVNRSVAWDFFNFTGFSQVHQLAISNSNVKNMHFPMNVGRAYPWKLVQVVNSPCLYAVTLSDNPTHFVAAFGIRIFSFDGDFQL